MPSFVFLSFCLASFFPSFLSSLRVPFLPHPHPKRQDNNNNRKKKSDKTHPPILIVTLVTGSSSSSRRRNSSSSCSGGSRNVLSPTGTGVRSAHRRGPPNSFNVWEQNETRSTDRRKA